MRVVKHWHRLPRDMVVSLSLQVFKLVMALISCNWTYLELRWDPTTSRGPFQPQLFCHSLTHLK